MMIIDIIQKSAVLLKEAAEMVLFSFMTHHSWFEFFDTSVLPNIILPIIAVTIAIGALMQWVKFAQMKNKTVDQFTRALFASITSVLIIVSVAGKIALGAAFSAGPFLFVGALATAVVYNIGDMITNLVKAFMAKPGSPQRSHHLQAAIRNAASIITVTLIIAAISTVLIAPAAPAVMMGIAATAIILTGLNFVWNAMPKKWKSAIKMRMGFNPKTEPLDVKIKTNNKFRDSEFFKKSATNDSSKQSTPKYKKIDGAQYDRLIDSSMELSV